VILATITEIKAQNYVYQKRPAAKRCACRS